ncbi:hypothetical protein L1987_87299 [Smallanthus sonchifolius]|nr:hypothetical protein L1987_87299 [Smallanthus sonchifolius]
MTMFCMLQLDMAEDCLKHANDLSGLLLLYSSLGDAEEIAKLASLAKENGKNNVAFACFFMLGKLEDCLQLLVDSNRIPEAALMARSYLTSKVSEIVALWRKELSKVNQKAAESLAEAAESLADPDEYSNMFEDLNHELQKQGHYPPAVEYVNHVDRSHVTLVEAFKHMQLDWMLRNHMKMENWIMRAFDCKLPLQFPPVSDISPSLSQSKTPLKTSVLQLQKSHTDTLLPVKLRKVRKSDVFTISCF